MTDGASVSLGGEDWRIIHQEQKHGAIKRTLECPLCRALIDESKAQGHIDRHDRAANQRKRQEEKRMLGFGAKPLPGQLGLPGVGKDVPGKAGKP